MKTISLVSSSLLLASILAFGCNSPNKAQAEADRARQEAEDKTNKAQVELNQQTQLAQAEVDRKQQQANAALTTTRNDYHARVSDLLINTDKRIADLRAENMTASASTKTKNNETLANLTSGRAVLESDLKQIDSATAADWDRIKGQTDKDISTQKGYLPLFAGKT